MTRVDNTLKPNRPRFLPTARREPDVRAMFGKSLTFCT